MQSAVIHFHFTTINIIIKEKRERVMWCEELEKEVWGWNGDVIDSLIIFHHYNIIMQNNKRSLIRKNRVNDENLLYFIFWQFYSNEHWSAASKHGLVNIIMWVSTYILKHLHKNDNGAMTKEKNMPEENIRMNLYTYIHIRTNICNENRFWWMCC